MPRRDDEYQIRMRNYYASAAFLAIAVLFASFLSVAGFYPVAVMAMAAPPMVVSGVFFVRGLNSR